MKRLHRREPRIALAAVLLASAVRAGEIAPADAARFSIGRQLIAPQAPSPFTLFDTSPDAALLSGLDAATLLDVRPETSAGAPKQPGSLDWKLDYNHSQLDDATRSDVLRSDASTGFSRRLDRDVLDLGLTWRLAGSSLGLGYQLQSARAHDAADISLSRFLPGNPLATHALTLGVSRKWGAGAPPPAPLVVVPPVPAASQPTATPTTSATQRRSRKALITTAGQTK